MNNVKISTHWKRDFFTVWIGQAFSLLGSGLVQFALVWWLTETTGSAVVLTSATFVALIPEVVLSPFAGALVDRWNRKRVMMIADGLVALATGVLVLLFWLNLIQIWHIYVILFVRALGGVFHYPAMQASTSLMVPDEHLARVAGANQTIRGILGIAAPPLGALLMELVPLYGVLSIDIITAAIAILAILLVPIPQPPVDTRAPLTTPRQLFGDVAEGARYLAKWRGAIVLVGMATLINFIISPAMTLMPLLITRHFQGDAFQLGWMESVQGVGIVAGGLLLAIWGGFKKRIHTTLTGLMGLGLGIALIGLAPANRFWLALGGSGIIGIMMPITNGPIHAMLQSRVAPEYQGRVIALINSAATAMIPLSLLAAAPVAEWLGVQAWFLAGGILTVLMGIYGFTNSSLLHIEDTAPVETKPVPVPAEIAEA